MALPKLERGASRAPNVACTFPELYAIARRPRQLDEQGSMTSRGDSANTIWPSPVMLGIRMSSISVKGVATCLYTHED